MSSLQKLPLPGTHWGAASHPDSRHSMTLHPMISKPTSQVYVAVESNSVVEYTGAAAFATTGGRPQSATKEN